MGKVVSSSAPHPFMKRKETFVTPRQRRRFEAKIKKSGIRQINLTENTLQKLRKK